ncbi:alpha/beta fold hydrolase [Streptomyces sp. NBC_01716]|uniref:alpha/beta fold hydrolase n=1 Tax=Streptomyces sp. NBC_01716 TaxID=2975917 RepID=UPI002E3505AE|nr:alpha/beta hydrolase [Streptomyces sp. NBC_01716]
MPSLRIDDAVNLHYDVHGRAHSGGEPVLLVTGTSTSVEHWAPTIIDSLAADRQIITYDHRGIGASPPHTEPVSMASLAVSVLPLFPQIAAQIRAVAHQWAANPAHEALDRLPGIERPTTVLVGEQDVFTPPRQARVVADAIPNAQLVVEGPGASRGLHFERPAEWLHHVRSHLARCASPLHA